MLDNYKNYSYTRIGFNAVNIIIYRMKTTDKENDNFTVETVNIRFIPNENLLLTPVEKLRKPEYDTTTNFLLSLRKPTIVRAKIYTPII